jgi:hypothetical protein
MKLVSGSAWRAAALMLACAASPAFAQGGYGGGGLDGLGFGLGHGGYGLAGLAGSGFGDPGYGGYGGFGGIGVGGLGHHGAHLGRYSLNPYSGYGGPGTLVPHYTYSGPYATLPPDSTVPYLLDLYTGRRSVMPPTTAAPYLTGRTYEPGDGYRYPLYYNPATAGYVYYPVAR